MTYDTRRTFISKSLAAAAIGGSAGLLSGCMGASQDSQSTDSDSAAHSDIALENPDVIIIGAGLAGLNAAHYLEAQGAKVQILEGRKRVGGRVYTLREVNGTPEAGGSGIGGSYGRLVGAAARFNVATPAKQLPREQRLIHIAQQLIQADEWETHALNPFPEQHKQSMPWALQYALFAKANPLTNPQQFLERKYFKYDISLYQFLKEQGLDHRSIMLSGGTNMGYGDASGPYGVSVLMFFNILAFISSIRSGGVVSVARGNQTIPEAMAAGLQTAVALGAHVVGIRSNPDNAEVLLKDGRQLRAKYIIVTAPFSALRLIKIDAPLAPLQARAIRTLGYSNVTQLHYVPKRKFWEEDGLPPAMWSDDVIARLMPQRNNPDNPDEITSFTLFANDRVAEYFDRVGARVANAHVLSALARARPSSKGALEFVTYHSWQSDPFAGGAYAVWKPGQISTFSADMARPAGRIYFAGEHTARASRGMEGAMESGEHSAFEIADRLAN